MIAVRTNQVRSGAHIRGGGAAHAASRTRRRLLFLVFLCSFPWVGQSVPLPDHDYATLARAAIDQVVLPAYAGHAPSDAPVGSRDRAVLHGRLHGGRRGGACGVRRSDGCVAARVAVRHRSGHARCGTRTHRVLARPSELGGAADEKGAAHARRVVARPRGARRQERCNQGISRRSSASFSACRATPTRAVLPGAIGRYQSNLADEILHEWTREGGFRQAALSRPEATSDEYADDAEVARDVMRVLSESIDAVIAAEAAGAARRERGEGETEARGELAKRAFDAQRRPQHRVDSRTGGDILAGSRIS